MAAARGMQVEVVWTQRPEEVMAADRVVLPGQGAIRDCMRELRDSGMYPAVRTGADQQAGDGGLCRHANAAGPQPRRLRR